MSALQDPRSRAAALLRGADGRLTATYQAYLDYQADFQEAKRQYDQALAEAQQQPALLSLWPIHGLVYEKKVRAAYNRWVVQGHKSDVERALILLDGTCEAP